MKNGTELPYFYHHIYIKRFFAYTGNSVETELDIQVLGNYPNHPPPHTKTNKQTNKTHSIVSHVSQDQKNKPTTLPLI